MREVPIFIFAALLIFVYGLFSRLSERSPVSAAMVFVAVGIGVGPLGFDFFELGMTSTTVRILAELTLVLVLFVDASTVDTRSLRARRGLPFRLLFLGLPLTMVLGILLAVPLFHGLSLWMVALMAFILSPTDAALGQPVVTSPLVPEKIREAINVESGLNDGIALPPILACIAGLSAVGGETTSLQYWLGFTVKQFVFGPLVGTLVGWLGGKLVERAATAGWMQPTFQRLSACSLAVVAFALAEMIHGNGFIAAYFGGLMLGVRTEEVRERIHEFGEAEGQQLGLFVFLIFGLAAVPIAMKYWDGLAWIYAILSLTVIRMLPVAISLWRTRLTKFSIAFVGWFGPRGIASVLYLLIVVNELGVKGYERILSIIILTVLLSVFLHGVTAVPFSRLYAGRAAEVDAL